MVLALTLILGAPKLVVQHEIAGQNPQSTYVDSISGNVAWVQPHEGVVLYRTGSKKLVKLAKGDISPGQIDCGAGLISVYVSDAKNQGRKTLTFRMKDGVKVGEIDGRYERRGRLIQTPTGIADLNGKVLHPFSDILVWDGPQKLAISSPSSEKKQLGWLNASWKQGKPVPLSENSMHFDGIMGNPEKGPFAVFEATNRTREVAGIFTKGLREIGPKTPTEVTDISPKGIVGYHLKYSDHNAENVQGDSFCLDPKTGKSIWKGKYAGKWVGNNLVSTEGRGQKPAVILIIDGRTGKLTQSINLSPKTERVFAVVGSTIFAAEQNPNRVVVYKLR